MPALTPDRWTELPRVPDPGPEVHDRPVLRVVTAPALLEGAGFPVRRPFPSRELGFREADPFLLLDHLGAVEYGPGEAKGAPWHPHRGFETVTYMIDGVMRHRDSQGGGGVITDGDTQWMTAGAGILHDEMPPEELVANGGLFHGVQLWVNLPRALKWTPPRYQSIDRHAVRLLTSSGGDVLLRLIAGEIGPWRGPGMTWTPITFIHATFEPGARLAMPWPTDFNALVYVLMGSGAVSPAGVLVREGQCAYLGAGGRVLMVASTQPESPTGRWEVLLLGGRPLREPIASYGPFVMNTREEIIQAFEDYQAGRMGTIPVTELRPPQAP
ncbi:MAG: pirin family protein [Firmicutes bacterium]|nr:pirin family protein [Alicyclobacillaceae bacterium]MCL6498210.1 pirin family protein [Bacillota bacterium]